MSGQSLKIEFEGGLGAMLSARLDLPSGKPRAFALFAHCFTCSKDSLAAAHIAGELAANGIATLRFDFTGLGDSGGDFANTNFTTNVQDLVAAADFLRARYEAPRILIGHSLGGAAVLAAAASMPEAVAVATIGAPADPDDVLRAFAADAERIETEGQGTVTLAGRQFTVRKQFLDDIASFSILGAIGNLRKALMVFHAPRDEYVSIDNASKIFRVAKHPKSFVSLDDADHLLTRRQDAAYVADVLAAWAVRYLPPVQEETATAGEHGSVTVSENGIGRLSQDISVGSHVLHADEPASVGGDDTGPTPYQLLSAALGACTVMTMRLYADRKEWPLEKGSVTVTHDKIHAVDCAECESKEGKVDSFQRVITLDGELTDEQRQRLLEIADKCPVHRTLHSQIDIKTRLAE